LSGNTLGANQDNFVNASQLAQLAYQSGSGTDTLWIRASDGAVWGNWSNAFTVTAPIDTGPIITPTNYSVQATHGQSFNASSFFSYSDPFGSSAVEYDVWDTGTGGGHFVDGTTFVPNQDNYLTAQFGLGTLVYQSGSGTDTLWIRANDGTSWGALVQRVHGNGTD
jgi:hypothetical protein